MKGKYLLLISLLTLVTWASWEEPELHSYAKPVHIVQFYVANVQSQNQADDLRQQMTAVPGVTACAINPHTQCATVLYQEENISAAELGRILSVGGVFEVSRIRTSKTSPTAAASERQCPVPSKYVLALEQLRFALNLRRLFICL
jgi:copper chaperone CopZ